MATGIVKGEQHSEDALLADSTNTEHFPLPDNEEMPSLTYSNKLTVEEILREVEHHYTSVDRDGTTTAIETIPRNSLVLADNFFGLKKLLDGYHGSVSCIYMDPPYGTGMSFQSRTLQHAYRDVLGTASWIEFIRRRLILMKELLSEDGSIYVHIGHQMLFHLKLIMDEVFGPSSFRNIITRKKCSSKNYTKNQYPNLNDFILFYTKTDSYIWNQPGTKPSKEWIKKEYPKQDERGLFKLVPIHAPGTRNGETGKPWRGMMPPTGKHWQMTPDKLEALAEKGEIYWSRNGNPRRKVYLPDDKKIPLPDYWDRYRDAHHQSIKITGYPTEKNLDMLKVIVGASSNPGDLVLDPFCGSGTTLHAARELGRHWIGIDQSFTAIEATLKRMRHGLSAMGDYVEKNIKMQKTEPLPLEEEAAIPPVNFIVDTEVLERHGDEVRLLASS
ncbi:site-specific DNA-methyltransferase [Thiolapillus brandeum]|uniref:site-specific DNA-methyltransferase (adenine-specific) n=1 Tax=Thiolapillus brandeum TaxID=1076588 RepID=A0A7U6GHR6_9GAMM|nr:site-specific DNA-methyltransferase [Thiolapillus brandeum]BAO43894.1 conserved hypothetical protein [Thiolapillus brandeum]